MIHPNRFMKNVIFLIFLTISFSAQWTFSNSNEHDIILYALSHNPDISLSRSQNAYDSLSLKAAKAGWLPELSISMIPGISLLDTSGTLQTKSIYDSLNSLKLSAPDSLIQSIDTSITNLNDLINLDPSRTLMNSIKIEQPLTGGSTLSASYTNSLTKIFNKNPAAFSHSFQISLNQPLLNSAWKYSDPYYSVAVKTNEHNQVSHEFKKTILSTLSNVRNLFWEYYAQKTYYSTYERDLSRATDLLQTTRSRFKFGESSALDTLSASYDCNNAMQKLLDSKIATSRAKNKLALALSISPDSLSISDSLPIKIPDLPDPSTLISLSRQFCPSLKIFDLMTEKLLLEKRKIGNSFLPSLNATASVSLDRSGTAFFSNDNFNNNAVVGLLFSYSLPLRKNSLALKQATLKINDNTISQKKFIDELTVNISELKESWDQEKQRIALAEKSKHLADLQFLAAQKEYQLGTIERLTLLDAQYKLVDSEIALTRARIEMKKLELILDEITGTLFQRFNLDI